MLMYQRFLSMIATVSIMIFHLLIPVILDKILGFPGYYFLYYFLFGVAILWASSFFKNHQYKNNFY